MINGNFEEVFSFCKKIARWSFINGTLILLIFYLTGNLMFTLIGLLYVATAALFNFGVLISVIWRLLKIKKLEKNLIKSILILLLNIPIVIVYYNVVETIIQMMD